MRSRTYMRIKSHPLSGRRVFLQTETGNSHIKYIFTVTLTTSDRTAVFARKSPLTKQRRLPSLFSKSSFSGLSKFSRLGTAVWFNQTTRLSRGHAYLSNFHLNGLRFVSIHNRTGGNWMSRSRIRPETLQGFSDSGANALAPSRNADTQQRLQR